MSPVTHVTRSSVWRASFTGFVVFTAGVAPLYAQGAILPTHRPASGRFVGTMATDRTGEGGLSIPARPAAGTATWRIEIDTIDWRPKFTVRIQLDSPDTSALVIRAANEKQPEARSHGVKILSTGASHANPGFVSAALMALEDGRPQPYMINNQVTFDSSDSSGAVRGAFELAPSPYA